MRIASIGDSFTEGVGDDIAPYAVRGWADLVAAGLAAAGHEVRYANFAIRGRLMKAIVDEQLPQALDLDPLPELLTVNGGGNDMLRPNLSMDDMRAQTERVIAACRDRGVRPLIVTGGNPSAHLPRQRMIDQRCDDFEQMLEELVKDHPGLDVVNNLADAELRTAPYWATDRLHLNALGHARVAARVLTALGIDTELPRAGDTDTVRTGLLADARFAAVYLLPWIGRRLLRRSSGDGRVAKYPDWVSIDMPA